MPPSVNRLYVKARNGQQTLTKEALLFREQVKRIVTDHLGAIRLPSDQETTFRIDVRLYFDKLENPGWFTQKGGERQAKTRYKKIDIDNRVKFLQDSVVTMVGIPDDSQIFMGCQSKYEDPDNPRAEVELSVIPAEPFLRRKT